ncbi:MAG: hypothetical protein E7331_08315 [Clostridiales bacterium]|nr:hypothetical protein [Clostridiales bacterium]
MKKIIARLIAWFIVLAALAALTIFVIIPLFAEEDTSDIDKPVVSYYEGEAEPLVMESDALLFEMDPTTTQFKLTDKVSGQEWLSNPAEASSDPVALAANKETLQSTVIVTYTNSSGTADFNNYKYSIENGTYTIEKLEDGAIKVNYAIGKIEKIYMIPTAITQERFNAFTEQMKKSTVKKLKSNYTLYEPEKLATKDNKDEILAMYPEAANQPLYVLKADTSETNKAKIEGYFAEANYTQEDFDLDQQLVAGKKDTTGPVFNVSLVYRLDGDDFVVEVPYSDIRYMPDYPITYVTPLPMFGAAGVEDEGFMFVPEGGGALINFNNGKLSQNTYYGNLYGWDYGVQRNELVNETRNTFPVFGMSKNGSSFICIMEGATSMGGVQADISMRYNSYNWLCAKYNVIHAEKYNVSAKTEQMVYMYEAEMPDVTIRQRYRFVNSGSYVEMANAYGSYLRENIPELVGAVASEKTPVVVELVGAIDKTVVKFGLPIDSVVPVTTFKEAEGVISELKEGGIENMSVRYSGWANGGVYQKVLTGVHVINSLGGEKGMKALIATAEQQGVPLYFDGITCFAYDSDVFDGFLPFTNAARYATREQIRIYHYDIITYLGMDWLDPFYVVKPQYAKENASNLISHLSENGAYGVAFRDIGNLLSADYNPKNLHNREVVKGMNIETMKEAKAAGQHVMIRMGNDYALPYADVITDMDLDGTKYSIIDQMVPFYQIALHGLKDYTGAPINLASDYWQEYLKCAEYGAGLSFTFMAEDTQILQDTTHSGFYAASYSSWGEDAVSLSTRYQSDMAGLNQLKIVDHEQRDQDVAITTYEDGTKVYVNYGEKSRSVDGVLIPAREYVVKGGSGK